MSRPDLDDDINSQNSWSEYRRLVTQTLKDLDQDIKILTKKVDEMRLQTAIDVTQLKTKAGVWGAIMGLVASVLTAIITEALLRGK